MSKIEYYEVIQGNLKAEKCTDDFGGPNMWRLHVKRTDGFFESVQWMGVHSIQRFFTTKLPVYKEISSTKYQLEK